LAIDIANKKAYSSDGTDIFEIGKETDISGKVSKSGDTMTGALGIVGSHSEFTTWQAQLVLYGGMVGSMGGYATTITNNIYRGQDNIWGYMNINDNVVEGSLIDLQPTAINFRFNSNGDTEAPGTFAVIHNEVVPTAANHLTRKDYVDTEIANAPTVPIGGVIMYNGLLVDIPSNWQLCDGTNGTPAMHDKFAMGTNTEAQIGDLTGSNDAVNVAHTHVFNGNQLAPHMHYVYVDSTAMKWDLSVAAGGVGGITASGSSGVTAAETTAGTPSGTIESEGQSAENKNIPLSVKLAYIQRMS